MKQVKGVSMNDKFNFGKFVVDCFICLGLMIFSFLIFSIPLSYVIGLFMKSISYKPTFSGCFGDISIIGLLTTLTLTIILIFLYKKKFIIYRIYKISFIISFISIMTIILFIEYTLKCNFVK